MLFTIPPRLLFPFFLFFSFPYIRHEGFVLLLIPSSPFFTSQYSSLSHHIIINNKNNQFPTPPSNNLSIFPLRTFHMTLCFSHLCFPIYFPIFLLALRLIMPHCYLHHYVQFMLNKYYFCKRSVHSFLGLSSKASPPLHLGSKCGLGLAFSNEYHPNVVGSSSLPLFNTKPVPPLSLSTKKKDPFGMGFVDDIGVTSCTESLGFESCNERRVDDPCTEFCEEESRDEWRNKKRGEGKRSEGKRNKKFPPPLPSLNQNGQPCFYLRPVRQNGRLELTEVWIHRSEVLRAVRENGRLRLHIVNSDDCCKSDEDGEEDEAEAIEHEEQEVHDLHEEEEEEYCVEAAIIASWYQRHHHGINDHRSLHVWRRPCVSIR